MFERVKNVNLSIIKEIEFRASKYPDAISLAQGIPSFDTPLCIKRRVERALKRGVVAKYSLSSGLPELRELIEISLVQEKMFYDWEKEIIVTAGSIEAITATILAITNPGDEIIIPEPTYTSYKEIVTLAGCQPVFVGLQEKNGWSLDIDWIKKAITKKTKAIFFCNPNNPTGTILKNEELLQIANIATGNNLFIITDEVYKDFIYNDSEYFSLAQLPELRKNIIRIFSFSKAYAMTGWRIAYLHSDEDNIKEILKVHDCLVTCAPVISQYAAMGALEMGENDIKNFRDQYIKRLNLACSRLDKLNNFFSYIKPNSSYFVFPSIINHASQKDYSNNSWGFALEILDKVQVALVPGVAFGPSGEGHVRINFGRNEDDINRAFDRIETFLKI